MKRPAQRRFHRAPAQGVRISGWSGQGPAAQPRKKSNLATRHACSLSTNPRRIIADWKRKFRGRQKLFFGSPSAAAPAAVVRRISKKPARRPEVPAPDCLRQQKGRREAGLFSLSKQSSSVPRGSRATPAETIVHADLDGVLVVPEPGADDRGGSTGESGAAEVVI